MNFIDDLLFKDECYQIIGLCMKIHSTLGKGFTEVVYKDAMEVEIKRGSIPYEREKIFRITYEGSVLPRFFKADYVVFESIILEIKAGWKLCSANFKQTLNYLKASGIQLGILINFGEDKLTFKRIVCSR